MPEPTGWEPEFYVDNDGEHEATIFIQDAHYQDHDTPVLRRVDLPKGLREELWPVMVRKLTAKGPVQ